jgi:hypothetical protein
VTIVTMGSDWELRDTDEGTETGGDDDLEIIDKLMKPATAKETRNRTSSSRMYTSKSGFFSWDSYLCRI